MSRSVRWGGIHVFLAFVIAMGLGGDGRSQEPKKPASHETAAPAASAPGSPGAEPTHELTATDLEAFLDGMMPSQLERENIAGAVIAVVKDGQVLFAKGYGYADMETRQ